MGRTDLIFLVGMPGAGKTWYGRQAAEALGMTFIDLDAFIEETTGRTVADIFEKDGEDAFRQLERTALKTICTRHGSKTIVACGGGTPCFYGNMELMNQSGLTIWLEAEIDLLVTRIGAERGRRPLFKGKNSVQIRETLGEMLAERERFYRQSRARIPVNKGITADLFTKTLLLSTIRNQ